MNTETTPGANCCRSGSSVPGFLAQRPWPDVREQADGLTLKVPPAALQALRVQKWLLLLGLNWTFVTAAAEILLTSDWQGSTMFSWQIPGFLLLAASGVWTTVNLGWSHLPRRFYLWLPVYLLLFVVMVVRGTLGDHRFEILAAQALAYAMIALLPLSWSRDMWTALLRTFAFHTAVAAVMLSYLLAEKGFALGRQLLATEVGPTLALTYAWPFLLFSWGRLHWFAKSSTALAMIVVVLTAVLSQTRGLLLQAFFSVAFFVLFCPAATGGGIRRKTSAVLVLVLAGAFVFLGLVGQTVVARDIRKLADRTEAIWTDEKYFEQEGRVRELDLLLDELAATEWAVGRGLGTPWVSAHIYGGKARYWVHIGYLQLVYEGGLVNLVLFLGGIVWAGVVAFRHRRRSVYLCAAAGVLLGRVVEMVHLGGPKPNLSFVLVCLSASMAISFEAAAPRSSS